MERQRAKPKLKKQLGLFEVTVYGVGVILGAGIYAIIGQGAGLAGNALWLAFIFAAIIASFTGLSYAELSSMYPKEAAEYVYTRKAFRRESLSFVIEWVMIIALIIAASAVSLGFAGYFIRLFGNVEMLLIPVAMVLIALLSIINFFGIKESAKFNIISTMIEFGGLVIIIVLGLSFIGSPDINYFEAPLGITGILSATALIFFAFIGFDEVANISEETRNAPKIIPKALLIALVISTILYILVSISAVSIFGWENLAASSAPLTDVAVHAMGPDMLIIMSVIALFATGNTVLIMLIVLSRLLYGMSSQGSLPGVFSKIHSKRGTPYISVFLVMALAIIFTTIGDIKFVATLTDIGIFVAYLFVNLSLIWLRFKEPHLERPFKVPLNIGRLPILAALGVVICVGMFFFFEPIILLAETAVIIVGYVIHRALSGRKERS